MLVVININTKLKKIILASHSHTQLSDKLLLSVFGIVIFSKHF